MGLIVEEGTQEIELNFRETVLPGQGVRVTQAYREAGKITQVMFHFPLGCAGLVEVKLEKDGRPFYPIRGALALDNATPVYYVQADYYPNEPMLLEILNRDQLNPHTISCTIVIRYKRPWWDKSGN